MDEIQLLQEISGKLDTLHSDLVTLDASISDLNSDLTSDNQDILNSLGAVLSSTNALSSSLSIIHTETITGVRSGVPYDVVFRYEYTLGDAAISVLLILVFLMSFFRFKFFSVRGMNG